MKIGILTFHWGTNYGAILQAWCLQEYLSEQGHMVEIINYHPSQYDFSWRRIIRHPSLWKTVPRALANRKKEELLVTFREKYLHETKRFYSFAKLRNELDSYDVLISGSDQVLNPGFTLHGEKGEPSPAYWLGIDDVHCRRLAYAVSFGCEKYPENAAQLAKNWVNGFDAVGTRERTGQYILDELKYKGPKCVVPDPTLLLGVRLYSKLGIKVSPVHAEYTCVYMLRHEVNVPGNIRYIDEKHHPLTMEQWLTTISNAGSIITNSYHGTLMAIYAHVPFAILLETGSGSGMNDRFFTLLDKLGCTNRVATTVEEATELLKRPIDFKALDEAILNYKTIGTEFLKDNIQ